MAIQKIEIRPKGTGNYEDVLYPKTSGDQVILNDASSVEAQYAAYIRMPGYGTTAGSANTYTLTLTPALSSLVAGVNVRIKIHAANTGASTLNINGKGAKSILDSKGAALTSNKLKLNSIYTLCYDGTNFILQGEGGDYGTAGAAQVLATHTIGTESGVIQGAIPSKGAQTYTPGTANQTIAAGQYLSGTQTIAGDADLVSTNIRAGVNIFGVVGNSNVVDTSSGTATAAQIISGAKAWVGGAEVTGSMIDYLPLSFGSGVWCMSENGDFPMDRYNRAGWGAANAAVLTGGGSGSNYHSSTDTYNGSTFASGTAITTARQNPVGIGLFAAGIACGGKTASSTYTTSCREFNGSTWSTGGSHLTARGEGGGCGTQTSGFTFGGYSTSAVLSSSELYNGSAWSSGVSMPIALYGNAGVGGQANAISCGDAQNSPYNGVHYWNGTSWSSGTHYSARRGSAAFGTPTDAVATGVDGAGGTTSAERYNGTSWAATGRMIIPLSSLSGCSGNASTVGVVLCGNSDSAYDGYRKAEKYLF